MKNILMGMILIAYSIVGSDSDVILDTKIAIPKIEIRYSIDIKDYVSRIDDVEINCLAKAIYYEARGESMKGKRAIGLVVMNRVNDRRYANSVCGVIKQHVTIGARKVCQFSWYCRDNKVLTKSINTDVYKQCEAIAKEVLSGGIDNFIPDAVSFRQSSIKAGFTKKGMVRVAQIGHHIFYKEKRDE